MVFPRSPECASFEAALSAERTRLVRLCTHLTGDPDAAEDLVQETFIEAWRHHHRLREPDRFAQWLSGIARNVCRRWTRMYGRDLHTCRLHEAQAAPELSQGATWVADAFDVEGWLERQELVELLDRALALLPSETRMILVERYAYQSPHVRIAQRLGVSEAAVKMKAQRGKLQLRRLLATTLHAQAAPYGITATEDAVWQPTRIWCPICGSTYLRGQFVTETRELRLRCPTCAPDPGVALINGGDAALFDGIQGFRPALSRLARSGSDYFHRISTRQVVPCQQCGQATPAHIGLEETTFAPRFRYGVSAVCAACGWRLCSALAVLPLCLPQGRRFWRAHPRIRMLPEREIAVAGQAAVLLTFESLLDQARLDVVCLRDTAAVVRVHTTPPVNPRSQIPRS